MRLVINSPVASIGIAEAGSPVAVPLRVAPEGLMMFLILVPASFITTFMARFTLKVYTAVEVAVSSTIGLALNTWMTGLSPAMADRA
jgi:hypothetical protein